VFNERDAEVLRNIERHLSEDDPKFAAMMSQDATPRAQRLRHDLAIAVVAMLATLCIVLVGVGGCVLIALCAAGVIGWRRARRAQWATDA
jgi:hypothetical protein